MNEHESENDLQSESLDELLSATRSTTSSPTGIPTPPLPGFSYLSSLRRGDVVEIQGPSGSGKTHLLYYLICSCILPLRFGGWNKASVVFDTDGTFDIHRLQTLLRMRLLHSFPSDENSARQIISATLRNIHIFRPKSSSQLAACLANLSSYHKRSLPTSEIALLAIDSASSFYWLDRLSVEQHSSARLVTLATPSPTTSNNPLQTIFTALWSFRRSHCPVVVVLNWFPRPISAAVNVPAVQQPELSSVNRTSSVSNPSHATRLSFTHRITLTRGRPSSQSAADGQTIAPLAGHGDIHVHVKTTVNHAEFLHMQINPEQVIITMADIAYATDGKEQL